MTVLMFLQTILGCYLSVALCSCFSAAKAVDDSGASSSEHARFCSARDPAVAPTTRRWVQPAVKPKAGKRTCVMAVTERGAVSEHSLIGTSSRRIQAHVKDSGLAPHVSLVPELRRHCPANMPPSPTKLYCAVRLPRIRCGRSPTCSGDYTRLHPESSLSLSRAPSRRPTQPDQRLACQCTPREAMATLASDKFKQVNQTRSVAIRVSLRALSPFTSSTVKQPHRFLSVSATGGLARGGISDSEILLVPYFSTIHRSERNLRSRLSIYHASFAHLCQNMPNSLPRMERDINNHAAQHFKFPPLPPKHR